jgi:hypothetical protein
MESLPAVPGLPGLLVKPSKTLFLQFSAFFGNLRPPRRRSQTERVFLVICPKYASMKQMLAFLLFTSCLSAQAQPGGWTSLFNGKDLTGWRPLNGKAHYFVDHGELVGETVPNQPNSFLATTQDFGDFILEFEFFLKDSMNSGVQFRSLSTADYQNGRVHGYQYEIDPSPRAWSGGIYDEARRLWLYPMELNPASKGAFKMNAWNTCRIECIGNTMRTWLNKLPMAHLVDTLRTPGFIALQVHAIGKASEQGRQIRFRNIRIKTTGLTPSPADRIFVRNLVPNNLSPQEKQNGYTLLFDGHSSTNWRGIYQKTFPPHGWEIKDGELTIHSSNGQEEGLGGDIVTQKQYGAFDLEFDFRLTPGANSGVKYFVQESYDSKGKSGIGLEYQVLDDELHPDAKLGKDGDRTLASLYDLIPRRQVPAALRKIGEWNHGRIIVYPNNHVEHWLNGYKVLEYEKGSPDFFDRVAISKFKIWPNFGHWSQGNILLQDHGNEVSYRSIKIKELN